MKNFNLLTHSLMNFLRKLFGFGAKTEPSNLQPETQSVETPPSNEFANDLLKGLFVENTPPPVEQPEQEQLSPLQEFMQTDFSSAGYNDGYAMHTTEFLQQKLSIIRASFRQIIDRAIDVRKQEIFQLRNQVIETRGLSERLSEQLDLRISEIEFNISKLEAEKAYSVEDEGLVMKAIHQYREGYLRGCREYQEAKLFAQTTGMFN